MIKEEWKVCPICQANRLGLQRLANHIIHTHPKSPEAGASHTSLRRLDELLNNRGYAIPDPDDTELNMPEKRSLRKALIATYQRWASKVRG